MAVLLLPALFSSCKNDELNSKELLAYIKFEGGDSRLDDITFARTPMSVTGASEIRFAGYLTRETSVDVSITAAPEKLGLHNTIQIIKRPMYHCLPLITKLWARVL